MATPPFALSVHHFISSVGADAGFAAIIGLAILVLLFFSQARDTSTLRRRAEEAEGQLDSLRSYVGQLSRALEQLRARPEPAPMQVARPPAAALAATAAPVRAVPMAQPPQPAPQPAFATIPAAPAGVAAPALSSATRLIPAGLEEQISIRALRSAAGGDQDPAVLPDGIDADFVGVYAAEEMQPQLATVAAPVPAPSAPAPSAPPPNSAAPTAAATSAAAPTAAATIGPPPSTVAGGATGAGANGTGTNGVASATPPAVPRPPARPAPAPPPRYVKASSRGRRSGRILVVLLGVAAVVAVIVVAVIVITGSGSSPSSPASSSHASGSAAAGSAGHHDRAHASTVASPPSSVTVAVLNSTSTPHLASTVMTKLSGVGYKQGAVTNAPDQPLTSTIVGYAKPAYRADALKIARSLRLGPASVQGASSSDLSAACATSAGACAVQVVVTVGADLASGG